VSLFSAFAEQTHAQSAATLQTEITQLKATVTALQATVATLQRQATATQVVDASQSASVAQLKSQMVTIFSSNVWAINPFVTLDLFCVTGPNLVFHGTNVHVVSGSGNSDDNLNPTGLGNLIIGYNEWFFGPLDRRGVHNLILGRYNKFTNLAWGGIVSGQLNTLNGFSRSSLVEAGTSPTPQPAPCAAAVKRKYCHGTKRIWAANSQK
jgi:hypothetical protein